MSKATVFSAAQFGMADESSVTGLLSGTGNYAGNSDTAEAPDHIGCVAGFAVYNQRKDVSIDGIIKTKGSGLASNIGTIIALANTTNNTRTRLSEDLDLTPDSNASIIITGSTIGLSATGFETGGITGIYHPFVATNAPVTLT